MFDPNFRAYSLHTGSLQGGEQSIIETGDPNFPSKIPVLIYLTNHLFCPRIYGIPATLPLLRLIRSRIRGRNCFSRHCRAGCPTRSGRSVAKSGQFFVNPGNMWVCHIVGSICLTLVSTYRTHISTSGQNFEISVFLEEFVPLLTQWLSKSHSPGGTI